MGGDPLKTKPIEMKDIMIFLMLKDLERSLENVKQLADLSSVEASMALLSDRGSQP